MWGGHDNEQHLKNIQLDDIVALKKGISEIVAVGKVVSRNGKIGGQGDKNWLRHFDGWSLESYVFVDWRQVLDSIYPKGLTRGTILRVNHEELKQRIINGFESGVPILIEESEPVLTKPVKDEEILTELIRCGLSPIQAENLTNAFVRIRRLANYYRQNCRWEDLREHEARTFLITPLLLALGWSEQQIKIEIGVPGGRVDIGCFLQPFHEETNRQCRLLIETKGFAQGLEFAPDQARRYAEHFPEKPHLVVTNGYCYRLYEWSDDRYSPRPSAYLNILDPRDGYPIDPENTKGCLEVLKALLP